MIEYFKNENVYKLPNRHIHYTFITTSVSRDPIFGKIGQRSMSYGHIMYTAIQLKCAITQYWVIVSSSYFGGNIWGHAQLFRYNLLPCQSRLSTNGSKNTGLYDQFDHNAYC